MRENCRGEWGCHEMRTVFQGGGGAGRQTQGPKINVVEKGIEKKPKGGGGTRPKRTRQSEYQNLQPEKNNFPRRVPKGGG